MRRAQDAPRAWPLAALALAARAGGRGGGRPADRRGDAASPAARRRRPATKHVTIGIKFDQPGLGLKNPDGDSTGFDVEVAKYVAKKLGYDETNIEWMETTVGADRETLLQNGEVDFVVAHLLDHRQAQEGRRLRRPVLHRPPGPAGPQRTTTRSPARGPQRQEALLGDGSTSAQNDQDKYPQARSCSEYDSYSECVDGAARAGQVDAVTTDDIILAGYAAQPSTGQVQARRQAFSNENYGIGLQKGDTASCGQDQRRAREA